MVGAWLVAGKYAALGLAQGTSTYIQRDAQERQVPEKGKQEHPLSEHVICLSPLQIYDTQRRRLLSVHVFLLPLPLFLPSISNTIDAIAPPPMLGKK